MKRLLLALSVVVLILMTSSAYAQQSGTMGPSMMGMGPGMMGPYMMGSPYGWCGPGMMGWGMMGPGMMGPGMMQPGMMWHYHGMQPQSQKTLEEKDARVILENYLQSTRNPNLKLGKIKDTGTTFEAEIVTTEGSLVDKIIVDKATGWMQSVY